MEGARSALLLQLTEGEISNAVVVVAKNVTSDEKMKELQADAFCDASEFKSEGVCMTKKLVSDNPIALWAVISIR